MFQWLSNQGQVFYEPVNGSTNYLSAYDRDGTLRRLAESQAERNETRKKAQREAEREGRPHIEPKLDAATIPPPTSRDLMPYPNNNKFVSQSVLSEELREEIWSRVMLKGHTVRRVSAELRVTMERVGAVVRLKEIEKEWQRIVSSFIAFRLPIPEYYDVLYR